MQESFGVIQLTFNPQPGHVVLCHDEKGRTFVLELIEPLEVEDDGSVAFWVAQGRFTDPDGWMTVDADLFVGILHSSFEVEL